MVGDSILEAFVELELYSNSILTFDLHKLHVVDKPDLATSERDHRTVHKSFNIRDKKHQAVLRREEFDVGTNDGKNEDEKPGTNKNKQSHSQFSPPEMFMGIHIVVLC
jgi:hypothetical protein